VKRCNDLFLDPNAPREGWLPCADPLYPGAPFPSAEIADTAAGVERGTFHSFIDGRVLDVFEFLVAHGGCKDLEAAYARVAELSGVPLPAAEPGEDG
jgi:hypothetical protein